jgi:hypothetical protein
LKRLTLKQSCYTDNDFDSIAERRVQEAGKRVTEREGHLFRTFTEKLVNTGMSAIAMTRQGAYYDKP